MCGESSAWSSRRRCQPLRAAVALLAMLWAGATSAGTYQSGDMLLSFCAEAARIDTVSGRVGTPLESGMCMGYIQAVSDMVETMAKFDPLLRLFCIPGGSNGVLTGQLSKIVYTYLRTHPEELHLTASSLTIAALREAFPCPTGQK